METDNVFYIANDAENSEVLADELRKVLYGRSTGCLSYASVLGVLEIIKAELLDEMNG